MTAVTVSSPVERTSGVATALRLTTTNLRLMAREPMVAVGLIGFPLATVLVLAGVFGQVPDPDFGGVAPDQHYLAGYIGVVIAALGLITLPVHIATARELGVTRHAGNRPLAVRAVANEQRVNELRSAERRLA